MNNKQPTRVVDARLSKEKDAIKISNRITGNVVSSAKKSP